MKNLFFFIFLLLCVIACDQEETECLICGTWYFSYTYAPANCEVFCGTSINDSPCSPEHVYFHDVCRMIVFNANGTFEIILDVNPEDGQNGTWEQNYLMSEGQAVFNNYNLITITSINDNYLFLSDNSGGGAVLYK